MLGFKSIFLVLLTLSMPMAGEVLAFDKNLGKEINMTCSACHGEFGQGTMDGTYPRLAGLDADYIARQLRQFKLRKRINIPMYPYASERELPEKDVLAISQYLAKLKLLARLPLIDKKTFDPLVRLNLAKKLANVPRYKGDVGKGARFYNRECASCHGRDGMGRRRGKHVTPRLTGQHSLYLLRQIKWIGKGVRFHDEKDDDELFASYSRKEINDALAYLSILDD